MIKSEDELVALGKQYREKFKGCVPVLVLVDKRSNLHINKEVYVCRPDHCFLHLLQQIRKNVKVRPEEGLFYLCGNSIITVGSLMSDLDARFCHDRAFLKITIYRENCFGGCRAQRGTGAL
jgi:Autophagy protein Atg8 ubiquitin like